LRSLTPFLIILAFGIWVQRKFITVEERMLAEKFGAEWLAFRKRTRRWL